MHSFIKGVLGAVVISCAQLSFHTTQTIGKVFPVFQFDPGAFLCSQF